MKKIDSAYDNIINANYDLFSMKLSELKTLAQTWYKGIDLKKFDNRFVRSDYEPNFVEMKKSGLVCNLFFAYVDDDVHYLLDGFNRLFTEYGAIEADTVVYLKVITDKLDDHRLMEIMYRLNMWKISNIAHTYGGFRITEFFDRGFRLFMHTYFNIDFYSYGSGERATRTRKDEDLRIINHYFITEDDTCADFKTSYEGVQILMSQVRVIEDFKALIKGNDYLTLPFKNYGMFLEGYARHLARLRYKGDTHIYQFDYFLNKLYENKAFFKKLVTMSGTDSTRKNIYHFYRDLNLQVSK